MRSPKCFDAAGAPVLTLFGVALAVRAAVAERVAAGAVTQSGLALATGYTQGHISAILAGCKRPNLWALDALAEAAGVEVVGTVAVARQ